MKIKEEEEKKANEWSIDGEFEKNPQSPSRGFTIENPVGVWKLFIMIWPKGETPWRQQRLNTRDICLKGDP